VIFDLRPHQVVDILNYEPFVTRVTDLDATVKDIYGGTQTLFRDLPKFSNIEKILGHRVQHQK